jgi:hypothetical protein
VIVATKEVSLKLFPTVIATLGVVAILVPARAGAQQIDLRPELTKEGFKDFAADMGSILRFRQLVDGTPLGRGTVDLSMQFADDSQSTNLGRSLSFPRVVARFGISDRVDLGAWGGFNSDSNYGLAGFDTRISLLREGPARPVTVSMRPSVTSLIGPSEVWVGTASIDITVSRTLGALSPYAGVAATGTLAIERSDDVDFDPATAERSLAYAGLAYRWRALSLSAEVERGTRVSYAFRIGTRF